MSAQRSIKSTDVAHTPRTRSAASAAPVSRRQLASSVLLQVRCRMRELPAATQKYSADDSVCPQVPLLVALSRSADAKQPTNKEADNNTSPYIQGWNQNSGDEVEFRPLIR